MVHIDRIHGRRGVRMICEPNVWDGVSKGYGTREGRNNCRFLHHIEGCLTVEVTSTEQTSQ